MRSSKLPSPMASKARLTRPGSASANSFASSMVASTEAGDRFIEVFISSVE